MTSPTLLLLLSFFLQTRSSHKLSCKLDKLERIDSQSSVSTGIYPTSHLTGVGDEYCSADHKTFEENPPAGGGVQSLGNQDSDPLTTHAESGTAAPGGQAPTQPPPGAPAWRPIFPEACVNAGLPGFGSVCSFWKLESPNLRKRGPESMPEGVDLIPWSHKYPLTWLLFPGSGLRTGFEHMSLTEWCQRDQ